MIRLSVNVNKVATLRNSRGGTFPSVVEASRVCLAAGAGGITVHPRHDQRHIRPDDVHDLAALMQDSRARGIELNIEGDPRPDWLALVHGVRPDQATLVPVRPGEVTSEAGWTRSAGAEDVPRIVRELKAQGIRVSVFIDATLDAAEWAARSGADRVEIYTEPFAAAFAKDRAAGERVFANHVAVAERCHALGLGINAGHDLDLDNLTLYRGLPHLEEVSIGHAIIGRAVFEGLAKVVTEYLSVLGSRATAGP